MKKLFFIIFCFFTLEKLSFSQDYLDFQTLNWENNVNGYIFKLEGTSFNITYNKSCAVTITVSKLNDKFKLLGSADNINLFGHYELTGNILSKEKGIMLVSFEGTIYFSQKEGGFPDGTETKMYLDLYFSSQGAKGTYRIAVIPDYINIEQTGTMDLYYVK